MLRRLAPKLIALVIGLVAALLLAEGLLQVLNPWIGRHSDTMFTIIEFDPVLGWKMPPEIETKVSFVDREDIPVRSNRWGFWDRDWPESKPEGRCRIVCLGDSFTWGMGVEAAERFSNRLALEDDRFEVLNFGIPGYGTDQALLAWRSSASRFSPDVVVLTIYQNDFGDNLFEVRNGRAKPYFARIGGKLKLENEPVPKLDFWESGVMHQVAPPYRPLYPVATFRRNRVVHWLAKNSDLVRMIYTMSRAASQAKAPELEPPSPSAGSGSSPAVELAPLLDAQVELMSDLVLTLSFDVEKSGARLVVVLAGDDSPLFRAEQAALEAALIPVLDATTTALAPRLGDRSIYFRYNQHWTAAAHEEVAGMLRALLESEGACGPATQGSAQ